MQKTDRLLILSGSIDQTSSINSSRSSLFTVGTTQSYLVVELYVGLNLKVGIFTNLLSIRSTYLLLLPTLNLIYFIKWVRIRINFECRFPLSCRGGAGKADTLRVNNFSKCQFMLVIPVNLNWLIMRFVFYEQVFIWLNLIYIFHVNRVPKYYQVSTLPDSLNKYLQIRVENT